MLFAYSVPWLGRLLARRGDPAAEATARRGVGAGAARSGCCSASPTPGSRASSGRGWPGEPEVAARGRGRAAAAHRASGRGAVPRRAAALPRPRRPAGRVVRRLPAEPGRPGLRGRLARGGGGLAGGRRPVRDGARAGRVRRRRGDRARRCGSSTASAPSPPRRCVRERLRAHGRARPARPARGDARQPGRPDAAPARRARAAARGHDERRDRRAARRSRCAPSTTTWPRSSASSACARGARRPPRRTSSGSSSSERPSPITSGPRPDVSTCRRHRGCRSRACRADLGVADVDRRRQAGDAWPCRRRLLAGDGDLVGAIGALDLDPVGSPPPPPGARLTSSSPTSLLADAERVGARAGDGVDLLEVVEVHDDVADVAGEARRAVGSSNASASSLPRKDSESRLAPPSTVSLPSPGAQLKRSKSPPRQATSSPWPPLTSSKSSPPISVSSPGPPSSTLSPSPPSSVSAIAAVEALTMSSPPRPSTRQPVGRLGAGDRARTSGRARTPPKRADRDLVVVVGARRRRGRVAVAGAEVGVDLEDVGRRQVADRDASSPSPASTSTRSTPRQLARPPARSGRRAGEPSRTSVSRAVAEVDADAVEAVAAGSKSITPSSPRSISSRRPRVQGEPVVGGRADDDQRALLDPRAAGGALDELALAVARPRRASGRRRSASRSRARTRRRRGRRRAAGAGRASPSRRTAARAPPGRRAGPSRRACAVTPGTSSWIASTSGRALAGVERQHGLLEEAARGSCPRSCAARRRSTRSTSKRRERSNVVVPRRRRRTRRRAAREPRGVPPPSSMMPLDARARSRRGGRRSRGSSGSVITAVLLVAKISASGPSARGGRREREQGDARRRGVRSIGEGPW